ncbi:MAG: thiamine pyrophosphate-binding protein [Acetobacteraceae bacterium]|nr:thiamine pyrophosphate-binding protein [Acetobacteraceae bacterium]
MELAHTRKAQITSRPGGRILADALVAHGIDHVFAVPGESYLDVLDGLYAVREKLTLITCRFEAGAVNMAEAYGKLTGRPAAAMVTRGPGACHGAIGVHTARQDSTPLLLFVGQIPFAETDRESFQEIDYRRMFGSVAKWVTQIDQAHRIPELVAHAVDVATRGRPGPVVIALSEEMQRDVVEVPDLGPARVAPPHPDPKALEELADLLARASRPLAILGGSGWTEQGRAAIREFLSAHELPVAVAFRRQALYDGTLPNFVGDLGVGSAPGLVAKAKEADLVLALGTRLSEAVTQGYTLFDLAGTTPIVHVYPEAEEIGRVFRPKLGIVSDLNVFAALASRLPPPSQPPWREWTQELRRLREKDQEVPEYPGFLNIARVLRSLQDMLPKEAVLTCDAGNFATWPTRFMNFGDNQRFIGPCNGAMGYAVPAAIAAKLIRPERMAIAFVGDGGFLMTGQELATAFHHGVAPIVLVFNNQMYGTIRMHQERVYPGRVSGTSLTNPDFAQYIKAFGGHGEKVATTDEFVPAFERAVASGKPAVIELLTDPEQITSRATISDLRAEAPARQSQHPSAKPVARRPASTRAALLRGKTPGGTR